MWDTKDKELMRELSQGGSFNQFKVFFKKFGSALSS